MAKRRNLRSASEAVDASAVAAWIVQALDACGYLYQEEAVYEIRNKFGEAFTYDNDNGNLAISRNVLSAFRRLTGEDVVWDRGERMWRHRESHDAPGRQQD
jgi:hypothetical protein